MSNAVRQLLDLFNALPEADQLSTMNEILRRKPIGDPDIDLAGLDALADELFCAMDQTEEINERKEPDDARS
jgi:hypothetical protein